MSPFLLVAFFLSGAAGLIFQIVWFHKAGLALGNTLWAITAVLASFMAGLALGNYLAGRYPPGQREAPRAYAAIEALVALMGLAATQLLLAVGPVTGYAGNWLGVVPVDTVRFLLVFLLLAFPATAMGATLPVLVGAVAGGRAFGPALGRCYGINTLGAVAGLLLSETVLIARLGVSRTAWVAAALCLAAAGLASLSRPAKEVGAPPESPVPRSHAPKASTTGTGPNLILAAACAAGGLLLMLEVIWFRFLSMFVLSTTLAASLMLAVVLFSISAGALLAGAWLRLNVRAGHHAPALAFAAGVVTVAAYAGFARTTSGVQVGDWPTILWMASALAAPTAFLSGALFTLLGDLLRHRVAPDARAAAWLTLSNTIGALAGPPVATFLFLPVLGMEQSFLAAGVGYGLAGAALYAANRVSSATEKALGRALGGGLVVALVLFPFGAMKDRYFPRVAGPYSTDGAAIVATREGPSETIFLMQQQWMGEPVYNRLVTNGFSMTGTATPALRYMRYFAYWPILLHDGPIRQALLICYGAGVTAGAILEAPGLESLDIVEISPDIAAMSDLMYPPGRHPLKDGRVRLHHSDGRFYLATTPQRFDLITGEPPPPRTPGAAGIYTREYFGLMYDRLNEGGIATYWLPVGRPDPGTDVDTIVTAFCDAFADCSLWNATPFDLMLVGTRGLAGPRTLAAFTRAWQTPGLQAGLREVGFERPEQIGTTFVGDAAYLRQLTRDTPPLTDDYPQRLTPDEARPSLSDPRYATVPAVAAHYQDVLSPTRAAEAFAASELIARWWPQELRSATMPYFDQQRVMNETLWEARSPLAPIQDLHALLTGTTLRTLPLWLLGSDEARQRVAETADDGTGAAEYARGLRALTGRDFSGAAVWLARAEARGLTASPVRPLRAYALAMAGDVSASRALVPAAGGQDAAEREFWRWLDATQPELRRARDPAN